MSENRGIYRALRISRALFPGMPLRFVGDSGLDDQKIFAQVARVDGQFIFRVKHEDVVITRKSPWLWERDDGGRIGSWPG